MKILVLAPKIVPHHTGTPIRIFEVSKRLGIKHEVFVLSLGLKKNFIKKNKIKIKIIPYGKLVHIKFLFNIIKYAKKYDIIYSHTYLPTLLAILSKPLHKKKIVCDPHGFVFSQIKFRTPIKKYLIKKLEKFSLKKSDYIIAVSNKMKNEIINFGFDRKKIEVIVTGCPEIGVMRTSKMRKNFRVKKNRTIGYTGNFHKYQGVNYLLNAFEKINEKYKDSKLILVGGTEKEIINLRKRYKNPNIMFKKRVSRNVVFEFMDICDILVIPRPKVLATEVGFPTKLSEYSISGKAIISTDVGNNSGIIKNGYNGILIDSKNIENELIEKIDYLFKNPKKTKELGNNARKYALKNLTWDSIIEKIERVLFTHFK